MDETIIFGRKLNELELRNDDRSIKEGALKLISFSFPSTLVAVAVVGTEPSTLVCLEVIETYTFA